MSTEKRISVRGRASTGAEGNELIKLAERLILVVLKGAKVRRHPFVQQPIEGSCNFIVSQNEQLAQVTMTERGRKFSNSTRMLHLPQPVEKSFIDSYHTGSHGVFEAHDGLGKEGAFLQFERH